MKKIIFLLMLISTAFAESSILLKSIVLLKKDTDVDITPDYNLVNYNVELPGDIKKLEETLPFNKPINKKTLNYIQLSIINFYKHNSRPIVEVVFPEQDISQGVVKVTILEGKVDTITVQTGKYFLTEKFKKYFCIKKDSYINFNEVNYDLNWINKNPFINADAIFAPSDKEGYTDIEILIKDRFPARIYVGIDNTGTDSTGNNRIFTGINLGNLFSAGHLLNYQYTTHPEFKKFMSHVLSYTAFLPWKHLVNLYGGYSYNSGKFTQEGITTPFKNDGFGLQVSLRYDIVLMPKNTLLQEISFGADFKRTNNNLAWGGDPIFAKYANLSQAMVSYNLGHTYKNITNTFEVEGFYSPGRIFSDQSNSDYNALRASAKNKYFYLRSAYSFNCTLKKFCFKTFLRGQYATKNLLYSEQYYLGGYNTIRGYDERIINVDNTFLMNLELTTPSLQLMKFIKRSLNEQLYFLTFFDLGWGNRHTTTSNEQKDFTIYSLGIGARYNIVPNVNFRVDLGFPLKKIDGSQVRKLHFGLVIGY